MNPAVFPCPAGEMPWLEAGCHHLQVTGVEGTGTGCRHGCLSITMTTFLSLGLWFVVIFWLMTFCHLSFTLYLYFFPRWVSVFFFLLPFSSLKSSSTEKFFFLMIFLSSLSVSSASSCRLRHLIPSPLCCSFPALSAQDQGAVGCIWLRRAQRRGWWGSWAGPLHRTSSSQRSLHRRGFLMAIQTDAKPVRL